MTAPICPYCHNTATLKDSSIVYGRSYGMIWICPNYPDCDSFVGVHKANNHPLGRMANQELRDWKKKAHAVFDTLWKGGKMSRGTAYHKLAEALNIPTSEAHIGMFDIEQCKAVVNFLNK